MKILIIGHSRHGKDTLAEIWRDSFGLTFESSSMAAARIFLFDALKGKYGYKTIQECFEDRVNHRGEWHDMICEYNKEDKARLAKSIMEHSNCYVGMRSDEEIHECLEHGIFDIIIGVDASERLPKEDRSSMSIDVEGWANIMIHNNGTLEEFKDKAMSLGQQLFAK